MICLGTATLILGLVMKSALVERIGSAVLILGLILLTLAYLGRPLGNRNWW